MMTVLPTAADYTAAFDAEAQRAYPSIAAFETRCGYALTPNRLHAAARVLACPVKAHPPSWQHGRVLYALTRAYLAGRPSEAVTLLDIGTAKGFSALCLQWALLDAGLAGQVISVDVLDPLGLERRNSIAEVDGPKQLADFLAPWPEAQAITFLQSTGVGWLKTHAGRVHVAFVDGKHRADVVEEEGKLLAKRQQPGDLAIFDDVQIFGVSGAVGCLRHLYDLELITAAPERQYAFGVRRG